MEVLKLVCYGTTMIDIEVRLVEQPLEGIQIYVANVVGITQSLSPGDGNIRKLIHDERHTVLN